MANANEAWLGVAKAAQCSSLSICSLGLVMNPGAASGSDDDPAAVPGSGNDPGAADDDEVQQLWGPPTTQALLENV